MKKEQDYIRDIVEIRTMMERSSRFLSLSGWAGIMAGIYALAGVWIAYSVLGFNPDQISCESAYEGNVCSGFGAVVLTAILVFVLALGTAIFFSYRNAAKKGEKLWSPASRQFLNDVLVPFVASTAVILILISKGLIGLIMPFSLLFYGLALYSAGKFTYKEIRVLGLIQIGLGLFSAYFIAYGLICWALGFGVAHITYGIYMHFRYER